MNPDLAQFSDWILALLPRLFLYPGGLWLLAMLIVLRVAFDGPHGLRSLPYKLASLGQNASTALAWVALALGPLPGIALLPLPPDMFVIVAMLVFSFVLSPITGQEASLSVALTLAVAAPLAGRSGLLATNLGADLPGWLSLCAVGIGLPALALHGSRTLAGDVRWLAWLGLGLQPLWTLSQVPLQGILWASLIYLLFIAAAAGLLRRTRPPETTLRLLCAIVWALAGLSLLSALLKAVP